MSKKNSCCYTIRDDKQTELEKQQSIMYTLVSALDSIKGLKGEAANKTYFDVIFGIRSCANKIKELI
jgi:hypothetical protein